MKNILKKLIASALLINIAVPSFAQTNKVRATIQTNVQNDKHVPLESATVELRKAGDSSLVKTSLTDKSGIAGFDNIVAGNYILKASTVHHNATWSSVIAIDGSQAIIPVMTLLLTARSTELGAVTVTARKPFIQKLRDRIVVNVDNSIVSTGSSAMEVLEKSPGIIIDQNDIISLRGKSGVIIMIDGKPSAMSGQDLANYLRGLPSSAIERIDIITNPSARYDAAGNAGIIDIRMKKDQRFGTNGTFTAGYGQGVYPKANAGMTFNYRNKKVNFFGNFNYAYRMNLNHLILDRNFFTDNGVFNGQDLKDNYTKIPIKGNSGRLGADFFISKKTIIGFVVNGNFNSLGRTNINESVVIDDQKQRASTFNTQATNDDKTKNFLGNLNLKHNFDSAGRELTADVDYARYGSSSFSRIATQYYRLDGMPLQPDYILDGDQDGQLGFFTAKADYTHPFSKASKMETGFKTSVVTADNDAKFWDVSNGTPVNDVNKTNHFNYRETNNAGYINISQDFKKFDVQFGLRGEHTHVNTRQENGDVRWDSSYFQLFPSAFFNYKIGDEKTIGISVSRRIDRPGYSQLNPFLFLIDVTTYATGAPGLLPQLTWSYELSYTVKSLNFSLVHSHTTNNQNIAIARFRDAFPNIPSEENVTVQIPINLKSSDYFGFSMAAPVRISKWWSMLNNASAFYEKFNGRLGITNLDKGRPALSAQINNSFTFNKGWTAELGGSVNTSRQYGFVKFDPQWALNAGVQKNIMKGKGTIRFNITNIFWTNLPKAIIVYDNYIEKWRTYRESRVANLTFTYRFGSNKVQQARRRSTGSEEERRRAQ